MQVLNDLSSEEEDVAEAFDDETLTRPSRLGTPLLRPGVTPALRALNISTEPEPPKLSETRPTLKIPITSLRTPPELLKQRLLIYDR